MLARIRRDLIDDSEAPGLSEVWAYPEVKALVKKMEKNGSLRRQGARKGAGWAEVRRRLATLRAIDRLADLGVRVSEGDKPPPELTKSVDFLLDSQESDGGIADLALADTPKGRAKMVALHFQGWAMSALCRVGYEGDRAGREGPAVPAGAPAGRRRLGLARGAHRFGAPGRPATW